MPKRTGEDSKEPGDVTETPVSAVVAKIHWQLRVSSRRPAMSAATCVAPTPDIRLSTPSGCSKDCLRLNRTGVAARGGAGKTTPVPSLTLPCYGSCRLPAALSDCLVAGLFEILADPDQQHARSRNRKRRRIAQSGSFGRSPNFKARSGLSQSQQTRCPEVRGRHAKGLTATLRVAGGVVSTPGLVASNLGGG
jgi:hypothetical protein